MTSRELGDTEVPNQLAIQLAFGNWALREVQREVEQNFPRLRAIPANLPIGLLELIESWSVEDQLLMLSARTKKVLNTGRQSDERPLFALDAREAWALQQFPFPTNVSRSVNEAIRRKREGAFVLPNGALKRAVKSTLRELLGKPLEDGGGEVEYVTHVSGMTIYTDVDFGSKLCQMRYSQRLLPRICETRVGLASSEHALRGVSLMILAGGIETVWSYLDAYGIPQAAEVLARLCMGFIDAIPTILDEARSIRV